MHVAAGAEPARNFWSFQPVHKVSPPQVKQSVWVRNPIDSFILARLEEKGIEQTPDAGRAELIRRVAFDLTGLPPTVQESEAFFRDTATDAYERMVDRYLASPHYGERWAQHWLDVVRFSETEGFEYDRLMPGLWRYRDYVIDAFNSDKPFDQFILEQVAGDELTPPRQEFQIAAGFFRLGQVRRNAGNQDVAAIRNEVLTDRTDIMGSAFLGLTMGCARCHDHKFDPIPQKDYYRLQAFVAASDEQNISLATAEEKAAWDSAAAATKKEISRLNQALKAASGTEKDKLQAQVEEAEAQLPAPLPEIDTVQNVASPAPTHLLKRGDWQTPGDPVGMRAPAILVSDDSPELPDSTSNPRTTLAHWLMDPANPLPARVMVNRIWLDHFGQGIVRTPNDFGANGTPPTHPELLDYLAACFVENGWRVKPIQRMILLSSTYRQSTGSPQASTITAKDPENRWLGRFSRRRLSAEEIRDAMLAVSGRLNLKAGGSSVVLPVDPQLVAQLFHPSQWIVTHDVTEHDRRSIYLLAKRNLRLPFMEAFDQPTLQTSCGRRESSTHAPQALELLNGTAANDLAKSFADRIRQEAGSDHASQVDAAFRLAVGRAPRSSEGRLAMKFLDEQSLDEFALAVFNLNAFLYVD